MKDNNKHKEDGVVLPDSSGMLVIEEHHELAELPELPAGLSLAKEEERAPEEDSRDGEVTITVTAIPGTISSPKHLNREYRFTSEHVVEVNNQSNHSFEARVDMEWNIPGVRKVTGYYFLYCKRRKRTISRQVLRSDWFQFSGTGTYRIIAGTLFRGHKAVANSNSFEVTDNDRKTDE